MVKKKEAIYLIIGAVLLVSAYFYLDTSDSLLQSVFTQATPIDWDEIFKRNIVKNSIPIELLETNGNSCTVYGLNFEMILAHGYFIKRDELSKKLQFDEQEKTIVVPCEELQGEKSRLNVWYVTDEDPDHPTEWKYFITEWTSDAVAP